ncbi:hypothetical protein CHMI_00382 [Cellulomonas hominis]|nr:hypothetical protein CHMI_00382 [Cellulomonas hominis]
MTTYPSPSSVVDPAYSMFRRTSVVMTTTGASPFCVVSPVSSPTRSAPYRRTRSLYFWFDSALMGVV